MSMVNGIAVKAGKSFRGMEGEGFQCNLYYNGKKAAFFNDEGNGGTPIIEYESDKMRENIEKAALQYRSACRESSYYKFMSVDTCIDIIIELVRCMDNIQRTWLKQIENGTKAVLFTAELAGCESQYTLYSSASDAQKDAADAAKKFIDTFRQGNLMDDKESCILTAVFASAKDFSVTIGTEAGGAEELDKEKKRLAEQKREYEESKRAEEEKQKAVEAKLANFTFEDDPNAQFKNYKVMTDLRTGKKTDVPLYALAEVKRVIAELEL